MPDLLEQPSYALIAGELCRLNRRGSATKRHKPLGVRVAEFLIHEGRIFVREDAGDFLVGMPHLYCLDQNLFITWLAELPPDGETYTQMRGVADGCLLCQGSSGRLLAVNGENGHLLAELPASAEALARQAEPELNFN